MAPILLMLAPLIVPRVIYGLVRLRWCIRHWERNVYVSRVSHDGREYRWCEECKKDAPYADRAWVRLDEEADRG